MKKMELTVQKRVENDLDHTKRITQLRTGEMSIKDPTKVIDISDLCEFKRYHPINADDQRDSVDETERMGRDLAIEMIFDDFSPVCSWFRVIYPTRHQFLMR